MCKSRSLRKNERERSPHFSSNVHLSRHFTHVSLTASDIYENTYTYIRPLITRLHLLLVSAQLPVQLHPAQRGGLYNGYESARSRASTRSSCLEHIYPLPTPFEVLLIICCRYMRCYSNIYCYIGSISVWLLERYHIQSSFQYLGRCGS